MERKVGKIKQGRVKKNKRDSMLQIGVKDESQSEEQMYMCISLLVCLLAIFLPLGKMLKATFMDPLNKTTNQVSQGKTITLKPIYVCGLQPTIKSYKLIQRM